MISFKATITGRSFSANADSDGKPSPVKVETAVS
jgi:hypothetical protein